MQTPIVPTEFVTLSSDWHGGQSSMLYAIASTGNLSMGSRRPIMNDEYDCSAYRPMTDEEWIAHMYVKLRNELNEILKYDINDANRHDIMLFRDWAQDVLDSMDA